jgi:hypothetical protein
MDETTVASALQELDITLADLLQQARQLQALETKPGIRCHRHWNPAAKTFTYHTHVVVEGIAASAVEHLSTLFFNAYSLQQHGWYSQFSRGAMWPLAFMPEVQGEQVQGEHQLGQGYFDFGVGALRRYHVLFSRIRIDTQTHAVVLRSVEEAVPALQASKQVFILPPTGDVFALDAAGLHWHHICTTSGVRLLPGVLDRWLMNALRATGLDHKERQTYIAEAEAFTRFVRTL